ncbi:hypothetical protein ACFSTD_23775 [Novosphingobium colocasiae]|uniref:Uncharacterized protein n=1 Tax=Novosphingobium colocasiae TaxID=1256513 RepID=A0A918PL35_9SPHN|nr:hypothetical protein [Novosphingobium colocasiae]GGZ14847.1 hypothetical protein GCM10011614_32290 [Novosphingobium colocasiae]
MSGHSEGLLPPGFEDLLEFVPHWVGSTAQERWDIRARSSMDDIRRFYTVMLARSEAILAHVGQFPLDALPEPVLRLFRLQLALAQAAMAVELHRQPRAINSPFPHSVRIVRTAEPTA